MSYEIVQPKTASDLSAKPFRDNVSRALGKQGKGRNRDFAHAESSLFVIPPPPPWRSTREIIWHYVYVSAHIQGCRKGGGGQGAELIPSKYLEREAWMRYGCATSFLN